MGRSLDEVQPSKVPELTAWQIEVSLQNAARNFLVTPRDYSALFRHESVGGKLRRFFVI